MKLINRIGKRRINTLLFVILFALILYFALRSFGLFLDEEDMYQVALEYSIEEEYEKSNEGCVAEKPLL